ncbi:MAG: hypothetical protein KFW09_05930 [Oscillospiraceae bacterium]|nr:hypothetical protein [Oscillospiraceae bacterium]
MIISFLETKNSINNLIISINSGADDLNIEFAKKIVETNNFYDYTNGFMLSDLDLPFYIIILISGIVVGSRINDLIKSGYANFMITRSSTKKFLNTTIISSLIYTFTISTIVMLSSLVIPMIFFAQKFHYVSIIDMILFSVSTIMFGLTACFYIFITLCLNIYIPNKFILKVLPFILLLMPMIITPIIEFVVGGLGSIPYMFGFESGYIIFSFDAISPGDYLTNVFILDHIVFYITFGTISIILYKLSKKSLKKKVF